LGVGVVIGSSLGLVTPVTLNPFVQPGMRGGLVFLALFLVILPSLAYLEMRFLWSRSRLGPDIERIGKRRQGGMGIIAPTSIGLAIGVMLGWALAGSF